MASIVYGVYRLWPGARENLATPGAQVNLATFSLLCWILSIDVRVVGIWAATRYLYTQKPARRAEKLGRIRRMSIISVRNICSDMYPLRNV